MKYLILFSTFFSCHLIYQFYNMFVAKQSFTNQFLSFKFNSTLTFTIAALLAFTPFLTVANFGFGFGYSYGYKNLEKNIWEISIIFICSQLLATILTAHFLLNSEFQKGPLIGFAFATTGLIIANIWK